MRTYKILCIALFAVLLSVLYFIESKYGEMSMFNGTPPFEFGDTGRRFVDVLETPILFAWFGVLFEVFQMAVKKTNIFSGASQYIKLAELRYRYRLDRYTA